MKKKFIPGIYNYCDRWCERCTFTSRCRNYESTSKLSPEQLDKDNTAFWDNISSNFKKSIRLLHKIAKDQGIDLNAIPKQEQEEHEKRGSYLRRTAKRHSLSVLCKQYQEIVRPFVKKSEGFVDKARELIDHLHLGIKSPEEVVYTVRDIADCFEIIQWYLFFIDAKLQRALHGKLDGEEWAIQNNYPKDSDGSAKIALIAIERSMKAWVSLYNLLPAKEDTILYSLALLEQLSRQTATEFPDALQFKRPGFDD